MRSLNTPQPLVLLLMLLGLCSPAQAGWNDFLKSIEEKAPQILKDTGLSDAGQASNLSTETLIKGLQEALRVGTQRAVAAAAKTDGYLGNDDIRIPLPRSLAIARDWLDKAGLQSLTKDFETSMNRAAEQAASKAAPIFLDALQGMTIEDAQAIYSGSKDAATRYFEGKTRQQLEAELQPIIMASMQENGVTRYYQLLVEQLKSYPLASTLGLGSMDLNEYVTPKAVDGLFELLATEEAKIRENPAARSTELLRQVFGS